MGVEIVEKIDSRGFYPQNRTYNTRIKLAVFYSIFKILLEENIFCLTTPSNQSVWRFYGRLAFKNKVFNFT